MRRGRLWETGKEEGEKVRDKDDEGKDRLLDRIDRNCDARTVEKRQNFQGSFRKRR